MVECPSCGLKTLGRFCATCGEKEAGDEDYSLRRYLEDDPSRPTHLLTVRGVGYRFQ